MCRDASAPLVARRVRKIRESAVSVETAFRLLSNGTRRQNRRVRKETIGCVSLTYVLIYELPLH